MFLQGGRQTQGVGDIVKPVRGIVGREQGSRVDVQSQQVPNGVGIFGAIQTVEDGSARIRFGSLIDLGFEPTGQAIVRCQVGARHARRRHGSSAQFADHFFPDVGVRRDGAKIHGVQREAAGLEALVVTGDAILVEDRAVGRVAEYKTCGKQPKPDRETLLNHLFEVYPKLHASG